MNGAEFIRRARRYPRRIVREFRLDSRRGKGSHQTAFMDVCFTTVQYGEIRPRTLVSMLRDLEIERRDF